MAAVFPGSYMEATTALEYIPSLQELKLLYSVAVVSVSLFPIPGPLLILLPLSRNLTPEWHQWSISRS